MADSTGKIPGGIVSVAVCVILFMAIVVPVTGSLASSIEPRMIQGDNGLDAADGPMIYSEDVTIVLTKNGGVPSVSVDGHSASFATGQFLLFSQQAGVECEAAELTVADYTSMSAVTRMAYPLTVSVSDGKMVVSGLRVVGETTDEIEWTYDVSGVLFTWNAGFQMTANYAKADLPVLVGSKQPLLYALDGGDQVFSYWYYDGAGVRLDGGAAVAVTSEDVTVNGASLERVSAFDVDSPSQYQCYAPLKWEGPDTTYTITQTLLSILPVIMAAAFISILAFWMFPDAKIGRKDETFTSR